MTTYPAPSDPVSAFTRADGTTKAHSDDHGNVIDIVVNAKKYLRGDGTTESASQITALQTAGTGKHIHFPKGNFVFPDSTGMTLTGATKVTGAGRQNTTISVKNAYAFTATSVSDVDISGIYFVNRTGATSGGGVKFDSVSSSKLHDLYCDSVSTCGDAPFYGKGVVGCHFDRLTAGGATAPGLKMDATGSSLAFNNANSVIRCRFVSTQGSTNAAIYSSGGGGNRFRDNIMESNRGYGIQIVSESSDLIEANWFEDNSNHNIIMSDGATNQIIGNKIQYNHGDVGTAEHIHITGSANGRHAHRIQGNIITDTSSSGTAISIGSGVEFTAIIANRGAGKANGTTISDSGSYTVMLYNDSGSTRYDDVKIPLTNSSGLGGRIAAGSGGSLVVKGDTQTGDNGDVVASGLFAVSDSLAEDEFGVSRKGYAVFHTTNGDPGTGMLPGNAFTFYWDETNQRLAVRYRANGGSTGTFNVAAATSSAYTVTNASTDRALNVTADTTAQVAAVLGTLIADLQTRGVLG